jgi:N-acetylneuraminic acid mutarotase
MQRHKKSNTRRLSAGLFTTFAHKILRLPSNRIRLHSSRLYRYSSAITNWWRRKNRQYGIWWRIGNLAGAALIIISIALPLAQQLYQTNRYKLSTSAQQLVGNSEPKLAKQLTYDAATQMYQFNKDGVTGTDLPSKLQHAAVGTPGATDKKTYALDVPEDFSKGVTYHDTNSQLSFSLKPQFSAMQGKQIAGHLVYPLTKGANSQAIYTLKNNGLKEDIVLPKATLDTESYSYTLNIPKTMEARVIPGSGAIGIYSANPNLFGDISYGSPNDQQNVEKARTAAEKTSLVFGLPAPIIKASLDGSIGQASARFTLNGTTLSVVGEHLLSSKGAITIDPSVVVTSTTDFQTSGNNEGMINFGTSGQINRAGLTGGSVPNWANTNALTTARTYHTSVAYNGYLYVIGGNDGTNGSYLSDVQYAPINANGTIGTWTATTSFTTGRYSHTSVAYNGYLYVIGGYNGAALSDVQYAPINANGTIGTWTATTSFTTARYGHTSVAYNGYLYVLGGTNGSTKYNDVQYAPINANGTIGTWTATTSFTTARYGHTSVAYNGYLYVVGGFGATPDLSDVQYALVNANGTIGTWTATTSFTNGRYGHTSVIYGGYLYVVGGNPMGSGAVGDVQYALVNANGTIGTWTATTSFTVASKGHTSVAYNGYLYVIGGFEAVSAITDVQYSTIDSPGVTGVFASTSAFATSRGGHTSVAYNGYLYVIGGTTSPTYYSDVQYAVINANATIGTWATTTALPAVRGYHTSVVYNGYLYVIGGTNGSINYSDVQYAPINANGTIGSWTATTSFTTGRDFHSSVVYNGYLYVIGGDNGSSVMNDVQYAPINANGTIGTWTVTTSFSGARSEQSSVVANGYVYIMGGYNSGALSDVQYAPINANGTIGTWTATTALPNARQLLTSVVYNGYLYIIGGVGASNYSDVRYAVINANGTIGTWTATTSFTTGRYDHTSVVYNGYLYVIGGATSGSSTLNDVQSAQINNGGSGVAGAWSTNTSFTTARYGHTSVVYNGYLYIIGGRNAGTLSDVEYAPINANGTIGSWTATTSFTTGRYDHTSVVYNGYLYVIGGYNGTVLSDVQYAPINANGTVGSWTATTALNGSRYAHTSVVYNSNLYVIGGYSGTLLSDVQYAPINANGTIGTWTATTSLTIPRTAHSSVAYNGYLYISGGSGPTGYLSDVQYAPINANGTIGSWTATTSFITARDFHSSVVYNGYLYVIGGYGGGNLSDVEYAPINANGTIGSWTATTSFTTGRYDHTSVVYNGYLYVMGGFDGTSYYNDVQYAPLSVINRVGHYSKLVDLGTTTAITGISYSGNVPNGSSALSYRAAGADGIFGASGTNGGITATACSSNVAARYVLVSVTLDDSSSGAVFLDSNGTHNANVTDFTVNYAVTHPAPNIRLRLGQTLQTGTLSPFDTCAP